MYKKTRTSIGETMGLTPHKMREKDITDEAAIESAEAAAVALDQQRTRTQPKKKKQPKE